MRTKVTVTIKSRSFFTYRPLDLSGYVEIIFIFSKFSPGGLILRLMYVAPDILSLAFPHLTPAQELTPMVERQQQIPGSARFGFTRFRRDPLYAVDDTGMLVYHYQPEKPAQSYLELRFCLAGNMYCNEDEDRCGKCLHHPPGGRAESLDLVHFHFTPVQLSQFISQRSSQEAVADRILAFSHESSFCRILPLCGKTRILLETLLNSRHEGSHRNIFINAQTQMILFYSLECMLGEKETDAVQCKFLANEADREKIVRAREILVQQIGEPITIRELSRKVAINECYLKKGFKEMFGTTIFDFYQGQRMEHARYLLYEKGLSVTEVSVLLGYSSISHFSTAFKKHTGLKPCELLFRS